MALGKTVLLDPDEASTRRRTKLRNIDAHTKPRRKDNDDDPATLHMSDDWDVASALQEQSVSERDEALADEDEASTAEDEALADEAEASTAGEEALADEVDTVDSVDQLDDQLSPSEFERQDAIDALDRAQVNKPEPVVYHNEVSYRSKANPWLYAAVNSLILIAIMSVFLIISCQQKRCDHTKIFYASAILFPISLILGCIVAWACVRWDVAPAYGTLAVSVLLLVALTFLTLKGEWT